MEQRILTMDKQAFELRIADLESRQEYMERKFIEDQRITRMRIVDLEVKVQNLEARIKDLDHVEQVAFAAYEKTHDQAHTALKEMNDAVEQAVYRSAFSFLPTVKEYQRRSKS
jgi:TolA-binding protein